MLRPSAGQTTIITNLRGGLSLSTLVRTLQRASEVSIQDILSVCIQRAFANDDKGLIRPTRTANGHLIEGSCDTCIIKWLPGRTPGRFNDFTLKSLVELSRGGSALGAHEAQHDVEPWVIQMRQLNSVISMNLKLKGTAQKFSADPPKAKTGETGPVSAVMEENLGMLKLRPWNKDATPGTSEEVRTPGSAWAILNEMEVASSKAILEVASLHREEVANTPTSRFTPLAPVPPSSLHSE